MRRQKHQSGFGTETMLLVLVVTVLAAVSLVLYQHYHNQSSTKNSAATNQTQQTQQQKTTTTSQTQTDPYAGWQTFTDNTSTLSSGISIKYPSDWHVNAQGGRTYAWSIAGAQGDITANNLFLPTSETAQQGWEFCAGTDACPGTSADDKTVSSSQSTINGFDAYTATIQNGTGTYHVTVIRGNKVTQPADTVPFVMFSIYNPDQATLNTFAAIMASATFPD